MAISPGMQAALHRLEKAAEKVRDAASPETSLQVFEDLVAESENLGVALVNILALLLLQLALSRGTKKTPLNFRRLPLAYLRYSWRRARTPEECQQHNSLVQGLRETIASWCAESEDRVQTYHDLAMFVEWKIAQTGQRTPTDQESLLHIPDWIVNKQFGQILALFYR